jgi:hypothetical protein
MRTKVAPNIFDVGDGFEIEMRFGRDRLVRRRCKSLQEAREMRDGLRLDRNRASRKRETDRYSKLKPVFSPAPVLCRCEKPWWDSHSGDCIRCGRACPAAVPIVLKRRAA